MVRGRTSLASRFRVEAENCDLIRKQLSKSLRKRNARATLLTSPPSVLTMHIKNKGHRLFTLNHPAQQKTCEKCLPCTGLAEDTVATLHEPIQINADRGVHIQRCAHIKEPTGFILYSKYASHIRLGSVVYRRKVSRNGFDRFGIFIPAQYLAECRAQHGPQTDRGIGTLSAQHLPDQRVVFVGRVDEDIRICRIEFHIGDHRKELTLLAPNHHEFPRFYILYVLRSIQLHFHPFNQGTTGDHTYKSRWFIHIELRCIWMLSCRGVRLPGEALLRSENSRRAPKHANSGGSQGKSEPKLSLHMCQVLLRFVNPPILYALRVCF